MRRKVAAEDECRVRQRWARKNTEREGGFEGEVLAVLGES
jgi:hypothetical protein